MVTAPAALCGAPIAGGPWLALAPWRPVPAPIAEPQPTVRARAVLERDRVIAAAGAGLLVLILTRWPVAAICLCVPRSRQGSTEARLRFANRTSAKSACSGGAMHLMLAVGASVSVLLFILFGLYQAASQHSRRR